jgi:2-polyprenyl-6-methoxyphenol hydroxylase-like FAD-dependent oxidoreductase
MISSIVLSESGFKVISNGVDVRFASGDRQHCDLVVGADGLEAAFAQYERDQRPHVTYAQGTAAPGGDQLVPATQDAIDARNRRLIAAALTPTPGE